MIWTKRAYASPQPQDGARFLVDRLWPRGVKREELELDGWLKEAAPSDELRRWFHHDRARWGEFKDRYFAELRDKPESWKPALEAAQSGRATLVYAAKDEACNNAVALKEFLERWMEHH